MIIKLLMEANIEFSSDFLDFSCRGGWVGVGVEVEVEAELVNIWHCHRIIYISAHVWLQCSSPCNVMIVFVRIFHYEE